MIQRPRWSHGHGFPIPDVLIEMRDSLGGNKGKDNSSNQRKCRFGSWLRNPTVARVWLGFTGFNPTYDYNFTGYHFKDFTQRASHQRRIRNAPMSKPAKLLRIASTKSSRKRFCFSVLTCCLIRCFRSSIF